MWIYRGCPKCHGDVFTDEDGEGCYVKCLQCGYEKELPRRHLTEKKRTLDQHKVSLFQLVNETR
jgi:hypothetical protein